MQHTLPSPAEANAMTRAEQRGSSPTPSESFCNKQCLISACAFAARKAGRNSGTGKWKSCVMLSQVMFVLETWTVSAILLAFHLAQEDFEGYCSSLPASQDKQLPSTH